MAGPGLCCGRRASSTDETAPIVQRVDAEGGRRVHAPRWLRGSKKVMLSLIACFIWVSMGGLVGLLGPAIPAIAKHLDVEDTSLGWAFTVRAGGYIIGSLITSRLPERGPSKVMVMAVAAVVSSAVNLVIPHSAVMLVLLFLCFFQGIGLSIISTLGNIVLLEYWGAKAGPWLQGLHFCFGIGAILSSLILGIFGMNMAFYTFAAVGMVPIVAVVTVEGSHKGYRRLRGTATGAVTGGQQPQSQPQAQTASLSDEEEGDGTEAGRRVKVAERKVSSLHLPTAAGETAAGAAARSPMGAQKEERDIEKDDKEDAMDGSGRQHQYQHQHQHQQHGGHTKRLSMTIMPFQETVMPVPVNQEDDMLDIAALLAGGMDCDSMDGSLSNTLAIATDLNLNASAHGGAGGVATPHAPLPASIKWLLTIFLGLYVGGECGFGGWISTFVLLKGATTSVSKAAFLVSIFWAAVTIGRAVAVGQAMVVGPSWSLRLQLFISLCGALTFLALGASSFHGAAFAAAIYGYGMSSVYPLGMSWPGEAGFYMDTATTATLVIGGCVGEAVVPLIIGAIMQWLGPEVLPLAILSVVCILGLALATIEGLGRRALYDEKQRRQRELEEEDEEDEELEVEAEKQPRTHAASSLPGLRGDGAFATGMDKVLDTSKSYHHRLSASGGASSFTLTRASAVFDGRTSPGPKMATKHSSNNAAAAARGKSSSEAPHIVTTIYGT